MKAEIRIVPYTPPAHGARKDELWLATVLGVDDDMLNFTFSSQLRNIKGYGKDINEAVFHVREQLDHLKESIIKQISATAEYNAKIEIRTIEVS